MSNALNRKSSPVEQTIDHFWLKEGDTAVLNTPDQPNIAFLEKELSMMRDPDFAADRARYPDRAFLREQSIWAVYIYRFGRRVRNRKPGTMRSIQLKFYWFFFRLIETITGVSLPLETQIGPGLRIYHFGNIFIHDEAVLGRNCTLRHGVTIGNRVEGGPSPVIGDDVDFGAYAQVLGNVRIGNGAKIGAMSVVLIDVPPGMTAFGVPARILPRGSVSRSTVASV